MLVSSILFVKNMAKLTYAKNGWLLHLRRPSLCLRAFLQFCQMKHGGIRVYICIYIYIYV